MQPVPDVTEADVERVVRREFGPSDVSAARAILAEYGSARESARVMLAALKCARGNLDSLRVAVRMGKTDYRDLLCAAEYPKGSSDWSKMDKMSEGERQAIYDEDWAQYETWLRRP